MDADLQNPPEEIGKLLAAMDAGHDYVGGVRRDREDSLVPAARLARDEPGARAHHPHSHDRPGMHAARLQPGDRRGGGREPRGEHVHPGPCLHIRQQSHRGRRRACRAGGRQVALSAVQAHPPQFRPHHRLLAGAAATLLDVRHAGVGAGAHCLRHRHRLPPGSCAPGRCAFGVLGPRHPRFLPRRHDAVRAGVDRRVRRPYLSSGPRAPALHDSRGARARGRSAGRAAGQENRSSVSRDCRR